MPNAINSEADLSLEESTTREFKGKGRKRPAGLAGKEKARLLSTIHKLKRVNRRLRRFAVSDDLTCALNRRCLPAILGAALTRAKVSGSISLCVFDVDNFKEYNDTHGHPAGDEALRRIANAVQDNLRNSTDKLFRCGGDEFCILFSSQSPLHALRLVERLRLAIQKGNELYPHANGEALTVSFGVVWHGGKTPRLLTPAELYAEADRMLYEAKGVGPGEIRQLVVEHSTHAKATQGTTQEATQGALTDPVGANSYLASSRLNFLASNLEAVFPRRVPDHFAQYAAEFSL